MSLHDLMKKSEDELQRIAGEAEKRNRRMEFITSSIILIAVLVAGIAYAVSKYNEYKIQKTLDARGIEIEAEMTSVPSQNRLSMLYGITYDVPYKFNVYSIVYTGKGTVLRRPTYYSNSDGSRRNPISIEYDPEDPQTNRPKDTVRLSTYVGTEMFYVAIFIGIALMLFKFLLKKLMKKIFNVQA